MQLGKVSLSFPREERRRQDYSLSMHRQGQMHRSSANVMYAACADQPCTNFGDRFENQCTL
jgi:hypothetical protein